MFILHIKIVRPLEQTENMQGKLLCLLFIHSLLLFILGNQTRGTCHTLNTAENATAIALQLDKEQCQGHFHPSLHSFVHLIPQVWQDPQHYLASLKDVKMDVKLDVCLAFLLDNAYLYFQIQIEKNRTTKREKYLPNFLSHLFSLISLVTKRGLRDILPSHHKQLIVPVSGYFSHGFNQTEKLKRRKHK